ncbi:MAG: hypothetical protein U1F09_00550 [Steroidobacteraceae bacterium]
MRWPTLSAGAWKALLIVVALLVTGLWMTELWYAPRTLAPGAGGTLGIKYHELHQWGRSRYVIDEIEPGSPLLAEGAQVGDVWMPDRYYDANRLVGAGERVGLTLMRGDVSRHVTVIAAPAATPVAAGPYVTAWVISLIALVTGLLVGLRGAERLAFRALAIFLLIWAAFKPIPSHDIMPAGTAFLVHHVLWAPTLPMALTCLGVFVFNFPDDQPRDTALKRWLLRWIVPALILSSLAWTLANFVHSSGYFVPMYRELGAANVLVFCLMTCAVMANNWRSTRGEVRQRHLWILLAFGSLMIALILITLASIASSDRRTLLMAAWFARSEGLFSIFVFGYAALRHRVVNLGFAVNRAMVYGAASLGMLLSFGLLEWGAHHLLKFTGSEKSIWLDAAIALGVFLAFHRLRHAGEQLIERIFFHTWHVKEQALRQFLREAPFITRPDALLAAFTTALDRFTGGAGHALYRRGRAGDYEQVTSTLDRAPQRIDADEPLAVALRAQQMPTHVSDARSALPGELALPSIHHGELDGFVVLGTKPNGETYRPDEKEVLGFAAHQVGLDFRALRMEQLERDVDALNARNQELETHIADLRLALQRSP